MTYILKYDNGAFVGEDFASGGYPYPTTNFAHAKFFSSHSASTALNNAKKYLANLIRQFPNDRFDENVYMISIRKV